MILKPLRGNGLPFAKRAFVWYVMGRLQKLVRGWSARKAITIVMIHGIRPSDTANAPEFPEIWAKIAEYLKECPVLVAHNAAFDIGCIRHSLEFYRIEKPDITFYCSLRAARKLYNFDCNKLDYLCNQFEIPYGLHHRAGDDAEMCARLFLREIRDAAKCNHENMDFCNGKL